MFSATDVANFLSCHHLSTLDRAEAAGTLKKPFFRDRGLDLLKELGLRHEKSYLDYMANVQGLEVFQVPTDVPWAEAVAQTTEALRRGVSAIYQATFLHGPWHGRSDFLIRVGKPSALGAWSYEPLETKLARSTKAGALIQLCFYSDLLTQIQQVQPSRMHIVLGRTTNPEGHAVAQYISYFRKIKRDFEASFNGSTNTYPEPTEHCDVCSWYPLCDKQRRDDDHLCLVAGITRNQRKTLAIHRVVTVAELAKLNLTSQLKIDGIGRPALMRINQQARLQVEGREAGRLVYQLLEACEPGIGLAALPAPSEGDIFLDIEGDPYASEQGLEYLIGTVTTPDGANAEPSYQASWSFDRAAEKAAFEKFVADVMERRRKYPDLHIYHYAPYEPTAIKRLVRQHGTCVDEVDQLLRAGVFDRNYAHFYVWSSVG